MTRYGSIYKITNLVNGKVYIGQTTTSVEQRWASHKCSINYAKYNSALYAAFRKHGTDNFLIEEVAVATDRASLDAAEDNCIATFNSLVPAGYNLCIGNGGRNHSESTKKKIKAYVHSEATRKQMSESQKQRYEDPKQRAKQGRVQSVAERKKRSETMKRIGHGFTHTPESIAKMAAAKKGKPNGKAKPISDQFGNIYISMTDAAKKTGNSVSAVSLVVSGKHKQTNGYIFTYITKG